MLSLSGIGTMIILNIAKTTIIDRIGEVSCCTVYDLLFSTSYSELKEECRSQIGSNVFLTGFEPFFHFSVTSLFGFLK